MDNKKGGTGTHYPLPTPQVLSFKRNLIRIDWKFPNATVVKELSPHINLTIYSMVETAPPCYLLFLFM